MGEGEGEGVEGGVWGVCVGGEGEMGWDGRWDVGNV